MSLLDIGQNIAYVDSSNGQQFQYTFFNAENWVSTDKGLYAEIFSLETLNLVYLIPIKTGISLK